MIRNPNIEYIDKFYVHGSEAKVIEFAPNKSKAKTSLPKPLQEKKTCIVIDPLALCGIVVAVVMILVMAVGLMDFRAAVAENRAVSEYVETLRDEHLMLEYQYRSSYDVSVVEETALALGMIPAEQAPVIAITVNIPEQKEAYTAWGDFLWSLSCLFSE